MCCRALALRNHSMCLNPIGARYFTSHRYFPTILHKLDAPKPENKHFAFQNFLNMQYLSSISTSADIMSRSPQSLICHMNKLHLHGHDFVLRELYNVEANYTLVLDTTYKYDISGPKVDAIWVPFNQAVTFDFDAYNVG